VARDGVLTGSRARAGSATLFHVIDMRSDMNETVVTPDGLQRLRDELEQLCTHGRREIAERLRQAAAGEVNPDESADYLGVRHDQALLERRIALLLARVSSAQVVEPQLGNGRVDIGERVRLRNVDSGERLELELVGPLEADPSAGRISIASPVGKAIHGLRRGEIAEVDAPRGRLRIKILAVEVAARRPGGVR
jgi:transcription elongation factor GreA